MRVIHSVSALILAGMIIMQGIRCGRIVMRQFTMGIITPHHALFIMPHQYAIGMMDIMAIVTAVMQTEVIVTDIITNVMAISIIAVIMMEAVVGDTTGVSLVIA